MHKNFNWVSVVALALVLILSACGSNNETDSESAADKESEKETTWDKINEEGEIVVGTSGTLYPTSYHKEENNELTGYDIEVMREVAKKLDIEVTFEEIGIDGIFAALKSGRIDAAINDIGIKEERKKTYSFSDPYKYSYTTMIVREEDLSGIESIEDVKGKKAGGAANTGYSQLAEHYGAEVVTYGNATNDVYLRDVDNGRTDLIINDYYLQSLALEAMPQFDLTLHPDIKMNPSKQAIMMGKEDQELQKKINEAIAELHEDGTLTEISKKFFNGQDASKKPEGDFEEVNYE
ncbi:transporter substrate-binding domain-containing protein [Pontibacillus salicampi]|uniref:Transporter substrate-binding domain-containing protein n=1 Tax=Pontibacillus salicampi TaxID=1449801 RepID=A0ABV6LN20_9BACI